MASSRSRLVIHASIGDGRQQGVSFSVDGPLDHLDHHPEPHGDLALAIFPDPLTPLREPRHALAFPRSTPRGFRQGAGLLLPGRGVLAPPVVLHQEVRARFLEQGVVLQRVVAAVEAHQQGKFGDPARGLDRPAEELGRVVLAVLGTLAKLEA